MAAPTLAGITLPYPQAYIENVTMRAASYASIDATIKHDLKSDVTGTYYVIAQIRWDELTDAELSTIQSAYDATLGGEDAGGVQFRSPGGTLYTAAKIYGSQLSLQILTYTGRKDTESGPFIPLHAVTLSLIMEPWLE